MIDELLGQIRDGKDLRATLQKIREAIRDRAAFDEALMAVGDGGLLIPLLQNEDPKVRKNTAALLGDLGVAEAAEPLFLAYQAEQTLFIRSTLLAALGRIGAEDYLEPLQKQYEKLCAAEPEEDERKHVAQELHVLQQILHQEEESVHHTFTGWKGKKSIFLTTLPGYGEVTEQALHRQCGVTKTAVSSSGVRAVAEDLRSVIKLRTFRDLFFMIPLPELDRDAKPEKVGEALGESILLSLLLHCHREEAPFYFRMEIRTGLPLQQREVYIRRLGMALEEKTARQLRNDPTEYEFEIRLLADGKDRLYAFLKMNTIPMERFAYRKETIAASMHPYLAALLMQLAKPWLKESSRVLDACCGVGTWLVERDRLMPSRELYGVDIFGEAVEKAKQNCQAADIEATLIKRDYTEFRSGQKFDEILADLPVRGKRTKEEHEEFYRQFFDKSVRLLAPGGVLVLYSGEEGFIKKQLRLHDRLKLKQEYPIRRKDGYMLYIIMLD